MENPAVKGRHLRRVRKGLLFSIPTASLTVKSTSHPPQLLTSPHLTSPHLSLNSEGRWGSTNYFTTSFLHFFLFSTALWDLVNSRPVHSLMLSSHLLLCLLSSSPFHCAWQDRTGQTWWKGETYPHHCSLSLFTMVRRSSCGLIACWILARTSSLVTWSLYKMCSILR